MGYWLNKPFWGIGLSAHSYFRDTPFGERFWNPSTIDAYTQQIKNFESAVAGAGSFPEALLPAEQYEILTSLQALTDTCHVSLRLDRGLNLTELNERFSPPETEEALKRLKSLSKRGLVFSENGFFRLTEEGLDLSNSVFREMTFLPDDIA